MGFFCQLGIIPATIMKKSTMAMACVHPQPLQLNRVVVGSGRTASQPWVFIVPPPHIKASPKRLFTQVLWSCELVVCLCSCLSVYVAVQTYRVAAGPNFTGVMGRRVALNARTFVCTAAAYYRLPALSHKN